MANRVVCLLDEFGKTQPPVIAVEADDTAAQNKCDSEADAWITANPDNSPVKRAVADGVFVDITYSETKQNGNLSNLWEMIITDVYPKVKFEWSQTSQ